MRLAVAKAFQSDETRCAATPETVKKIVALGFDVDVEENAGAQSSCSDEMYRQAGATIVKTKKSLFAKADVILTVDAPSVADLKIIKKDTNIIGMLSPYRNLDFILASTGAGVVLFSMEFVPRITRAQSMDVLSSQSNLAGYKSVLDATYEFQRALPMMMTAAGMISPARVFVMGAGVAGLQAIATAKRLGAIVSATDVRLSAKEQVESLGADFVMVEDDETENAETAGGYAKEMSAEYKKKQQNLIEDTISKQDIVITTALIPGRPAPVLVTEAMVKSMKTGSVIVDMAVEWGGNCVSSEVDKVVDVNGVKIMGYKNIAGRIAVDASALYARNLYNFLALLVDKEEKSIKIDFEDEIIKGTCLIYGGKITNENIEKILKLKSQKIPEKKTSTKKTTAKKTVKKKTKVKAKTAKKTTKKTSKK